MIQLLTVGVIGKSLKENEAKISEEIKKEIEQKIEELKGSLNSDNISEIKQKIETLSLAIQKIGQSIYGDKGKK